MKIYFCDGCNESIPLADIQSGQVTTIKGKLFCRNCIPPGAGTAPATAAPPVGRRGTHPLVIVLLLGLIGYLVWRDLPRLTAAVTGDNEVAAEFDDRGQQARFDGLEAKLTAMGSSLDELERKLVFQHGDTDTVRGGIADLGRGVDQLRDQLDGLQRSQAETGQLIEKLHFVDNRIQALDARIDTLADMLTHQQQDLAAGLAQRAADNSAPAGAAPAVDTTLQAELESIRRQLLDPDAGQRFAAVDRISKGRLKQLAPNLLPVLKDEDAFVRILAMQAIGDFGYVEAVPALFETLDDPSPPIRKTAAETLKRLTGYDAGYDSRASKAERDKAVKKWRELVGGAAAK